MSRAPEIPTVRLILSPLAAGDAVALLEYRSDPDVCRYQSFEPASLEDVERFLDGLHADVFGVPGAWFQFGIRLRDSGRLVGDLGVRLQGEDARQAELGFTVAPGYQRRGIGTEAVRGMLGHLFESLDTHRVVASVDPRNGPSIALLRRVGMRQEAHFRRSLWFKGEWVDDLVFGMLKSEWQGRGAPS